MHTGNWTRSSQGKILAFVLLMDRSFQGKDSRTFWSKCFKLTFSKVFVSLKICIFHEILSGTIGRINSLKICQQCE